MARALRSRIPEAETSTSGSDAVPSFLAITSILLLSLQGEAKDTTATHAVVDAPIVQVTVSPDGARMTRRGQVALPVGRSHVRIEVVEGSIADVLQDIAGISASSSEGTNVLSIELVDGLRRVSEAEVIQLATEVKLCDEELATARRLLENAHADLSILDVFGRRTVENAGAIAGTTDLDLAEFDQQLEFISGKRMAILQTREAAEKLALELEKTCAELRERLELADAGTPIMFAELEVKSTGGMSDLALSWFTYDAIWSPEFTIRSDSETLSASVELSATILNDTANDWTGVQLVLSTAETVPMGAPPSVKPVEVGIAPEPSEQDGVASRARANGLFGEAGVINVGPAMIYTLAEPVTLPRKTSKRLLVDRFQTSCTLEALARPVVVPGIFSRGTIRNAPELLLLSGPCALFLDGAFVGQVELEEVPPGADFDVWYGEIHGIRAERTILERETVKTGLLGGGRLTRTSFRITIRNSRPEPIDLIIEDRIPVSRSGEIEVSLKNVSPALSNNTEYLKEERPLGMLRWDISLPAGGPDAQPVFIEWTVNVSRSSEIKTTPIPK